MKSLKRILPLCLLVLSLACIAFAFTACGDEETTENACAHTYGDWTTVTAENCDTAGQKQQVCTKCGDVVTGTIFANGHTYGEWTPIKEADCETEGQKERLCSVCGAVHTSSIPKTNHTDADSDNVCDVCGEDLSNKITYTVTLVDINGAPIEDAKVSIDGKVEASTDANGNATFAIDETDGALYAQIMSLPQGYSKTNSDDLEFFDGKTTVTITYGKKLTAYTVKVVNESDEAQEGIALQICHVVCLEDVYTSDNGEVTVYIDPDSAKGGVKVKLKSENYELVGDVTDEEGYVKFDTDSTSLTITVRAK